MPLSKLTPHRQEEDATAPALTSGLPFDARHQDVVRAAREGRHSEAAQLAAIGEREDITAHGITSDQAVVRLETHAVLADLRGDRDQAVRLRATVTRMGKNPNWFEGAESTEPAWHSGPQPLLAPEPQAAQPPARRRRVWPYWVVAAAVAITAAGVWRESTERQKREDRKVQVAAYKGEVDTALTVDGVNAELAARWTGDRRVIVQLRTYGDPNAKYLRIEAAGEMATSVKQDGWFPQSPEIVVPVNDRQDEVTVQIAVGGKSWQQGSRACCESG
ncbi:hypothetical protein [Streptomyces fradiae]|uniref:hypothetical protein n=1 Tax=Streptomyces fradiae TaxID=1906 RepID=UPI0038241758